MDLWKCFQHLLLAPFNGILISVNDSDFNLKCFHLNTLNGGFNQDEMWPGINQCTEKKICQPAIIVS